MAVVRRAVDAVAPGRAVPVDDALGLRVGEAPDGGVQLRVPYPVVPAERAGSDVGVGGPGAGGPGVGGPGVGDLGVGATVALCVLADAACGITMARAQGVEISGPTIELRVDHARPPADGANWLFAEASLRHTAGGAGLLTARLSDDTGSSVALASGHFLVLPTALEPERLPTGLDGRYTSAALVDILGGTDNRPDGGPPDVWSVPAVSALANPRNQVHGGVLMAIGQLAQRRMQMAGVLGTHPPLPLSVTAEYLRPAAIDGAPLHCRTEYVRRGRRYRGLRTELTGSDQRICAVVSGLWAVRP